MFGNWTFGTLVFTVLVFTVTFKVATHAPGGTRQTGIMNVSSEIWAGPKFSRLMSRPCLVAGSRHSLLDLDQPFCHLGLADFLCGLLSAVGRHHLVRRAENGTDLSVTAVADLP